MRVWPGNGTKLALQSDRRPTELPYKTNKSAVAVCTSDNHSSSYCDSLLMPKSF